MCLAALFAGWPAVPARGNTAGQSSCAPGAPSGLTATAGDSQVTLSWSPPAPPASKKCDPFEGYNIYEETSPFTVTGMQKPVNRSLALSTSYLVTGLSDGTTYYFTVTAVYGVANLGISSGQVSATPQSPLGAPTGLAATPGNSQVTLSWSPPPSGGPPVAGYDIYQGTSPGDEPASPVNTSAVQGTSYLVTGLSDGTTYYFTVTAADSAGQQGPPSGQVSATPQGPLPSGQASPTPHRPLPSHSPPPLSRPSGWLIGHALPPPSWSVFALPKVLESLALGALLVVLVGFPAELFNQTYEKNEARIRRGLSKVTHWKARGTGSVAGPWIAFPFFAVAAVCTALVEPAFDFGWTGATVFAGFVVAIPLTMVAYAYPSEWYERRASKVTGRFHVIALALIVAASLTIMSRLVHFVPGYVYGLVAGFTATRTLSRTQQAKSVLAGTACVFALSVVAWVLWGKYDAVAQGPHASHAEAIIGAVLAQVTILAITSVVFGLMPFKFLDGHRLRTWNLAGWLAVYAVAAFWFVLVLIRNNRDVLQKHTLPVAFAEPFILFAVFGILSILFWLYFRLRPSPENAPEDMTAPRVTPPEGTGSNVPDLARPGG